MKKKALTEALLNAIQKANEEYEDLSGGSWLSDYGAESFLVVEAMKQLLAAARRSRKRACATSEESFAEIMDCAGANKKPGPLPAVLAGNYRADIVLWRNDSQPFGVVEVKRQWTNGPCMADVRRLRALMDRGGAHLGGSIEYCALVVFIPQAGDEGLEKVKRQYENIAGYLNAHAQRRFRFHTLEPWQYTYHPDGTYGDYSGGGIVVEFY